MRGIGRRLLVALAALPVLAALLVGTGAPPALAAGDPVVVTGGDIACDPADANYNGGAGTPGFCHMRATAGLVNQIKPTAVLMVGDAQYNTGSLANYNASYQPTWGVFKPTTKPVVGNHDYGTPGASGYFSYFGSAATPRSPSCRSGCQGYYSLDIGAWHVVAINSECALLNGGAGCAVGSPQEVWLKNDLAAHPTACTLVFDHRPRWSSNSFASADIAPLVSDMYAAHVDLLVSGHAHSYERFSPMNPSGNAFANGVRQFVVGTGGASSTGFGTPAAHSQVRRTGVFGVLKLTLRATSYTWSFVADPSTPFTDTGTSSCH